MTTLDEIGNWTEMKLEIIRDYAGAYSKLLKAYNLHYLYIDGFAGAGEHISKSTGRIVKGSPLIVLDIKPPFEEYHFVDIDSNKIGGLKNIVADRPGVYLHIGDCNTILPKNIFPTIQYKDFRRAFCLLDPYGLHIDWNVIQSAGKIGTIDLLLNFPIMDINRNVLRTNPEDISSENMTRMNRFWGDDSWMGIAYESTSNLLGWLMKVTNASKVITEAFQQRLNQVASFQYVSDRLPMRNSKRNIVYFLFFASQNETAIKIMRGIFQKHK
jgi:three-Cys-motif partner protein